MKQVVCGIVSGALMCGAGAAAPIVVYQNSFSDPAGSEWSSSAAYTNEQEGAQLGRFQTETVSITLDTRDGQAYSITFDLMTYGSWNGHENGSRWEDSWQLRQGDQTLLNAVIDIHHETSQHGFAAPDAVYHASNAGATEMMFRGVTVGFVATGAQTRLDFVAEVTGSNEYWALDNVRVTTAEVPGVGPLATLGVAGSIAVRRRRRGV